MISYIISRYILWLDLCVYITDQIENATQIDEEVPEDIKRVIKRVEEVRKNQFDFFLIIKTIIFFIGVRWRQLYFHWCRKVYQKYYQIREENAGKETRKAWDPMQ